MPAAFRNSRQLALACARIAAERKASDVVVLDVQRQLYLTEYFVIATGQSDRHLRALAEEMTERLAEQGVRRFGLEGAQDARWVLVDFGGVIVHLFLDEARDFYGLESLWADARKVKTADAEAEPESEAQDEAPPPKRKAAKAAGTEKTASDLRKQARHKAKKARNKAAKKAKSPSKASR